ncbi:MAG: PA0069 family radical SAM protein [Hyphomicrobiaceae bacterium]
MVEELGTIVAKDRRRGRGARSNASGRYDRLQRFSFDDGWQSLATLEAFKTTVKVETASSIIATNNSPDISFDQSINPYRGCEHGCSYCYARPGHAYLGHSPGLDFETHLYAKTNAAELLEAALSRSNYVPKTIALGAVTDAYQPIERKYRIARQILEVMDKYNHPVGIVTKSSLIVRDIDILSHLANRRLVKVALSITTLDRALARMMEPRAPTPDRRLAAIRALSEAGIPTTVMVAPIIPGLNDHEIEKILAASAESGATSAAYVLLRLPLELKELFREWLTTEFPNRSSRIIKLLQSTQGGKDYSAEFGLRQRGQGPFADMIALRFKKALQRLQLNQKSYSLRTDLFRKPERATDQLSLF